jgi:hypothetical protein
MFSISIYHLDFGTSVAMEHNVSTLGEVADFGNEICQSCTKFELKTKLNINRETRHFAKRVLAEGLSHKL